MQNRLDYDAFEVLLGQMILGETRLDIDDFPDSPTYEWWKSGLSIAEAYAEWLDWQGLDEVQTTTRDDSEDFVEYEDHHLWRG